MSEPVIAVDRVSKRYHLGTTFADSLSQRLERAIRSPFRRSGKAKKGGDGQPERDPNEFWALRDVSLEVAPGEVMGLIGDNGAGKSTLLKLLSQITLPTSGEIRMHGTVGSLLEVGTGFHPELTGRENVFLNGAVLGMRRAEIIRQFPEIVEFSGISQFIDTPVKRYSSGMYVRLAFAVAAHLQPEIMLIDEVLAVGDQEFQRKCLGKMDDAARSGRTVIFVSHNLSSVQRLCDRTVWLSHGRIAQIGPTRDVVTAYLQETEPDQESGEVDISRRGQRGGTGDARLLSLRMTDEEGLPSTSLQLGQPFTVDIEFELYEAAHELTVMLGLSSADGSRVMQTLSADDEGGPVALQPGVFRVQASVDLPLQPGEYHVDVGLYETDTRAIDFVDRGLHFTVVNVPHEGTGRYPWSVPYGYVRPRSSWSVVMPADPPVTAAGEARSPAPRVR